MEHLDGNSYYWTPVNIIEAVGDRPFGPTCLSDDGVSVLYALLDQGTGPYLASQIRKAINDACAKYACMGRDGFMELVQLGMLERAGNFYQWSNALREEVKGHLPF